MEKEGEGGGGVGFVPLGGRGGVSFSFSSFCFVLYFSFLAHPHPRTSHIERGQWRRVRGNQNATDCSEMKEKKTKTHRRMIPMAMDRHLRTVRPRARFGCDGRVVDRGIVVCVRGREGEAAACVGAGWGRVGWRGGGGVAVEGWTGGYFGCFVLLGFFGREERVGLLDFVCLEAKRRKPGCFDSLSRCGLGSGLGLEGL